MAYTRFTQRTNVTWAAAGGGQLAYPVHDVDHNVFVYDAIDNGWYIGADEPDAPYPGGKLARVKFKTWLRGATSGTTIPEMILLMACGFADTDQTTSHLYRVGDMHLSGEGAGKTVPIDLTVITDKLAHPCDSAVGTFTMHFVAGQLPVVDWEFLGAPDSENAAMAQPSITTANLSDPAPCQNYSGTVNAQTVGLREIHCAMNNRLDPRPDVNGSTGYGSAHITGRKPIYEILIEADTTNVNPMTLYAARTEFTTAFTHDSGGGVNNEVDISFVGVIAETPQLEEGSDGCLLYRCKIAPKVASTGFALDWKDA